MSRRLLSSFPFPVYLTLCFAIGILNWPATVPGQEAPATPDAGQIKQAKQEALEKDVTQGALRVVKEDGSVVECPLRHTDVLVDIAGFIGRVKVVQTFHNPLKEKIEAVYVFPLPHEASIDDMTMVIGDRRIVGVIKRRAEARQIYQQALAAGQTASLLEQERPNIFTQSVGNIDPGQEVKIEISYVDVLRYDIGTYEFQFPMVVGPRYIPGADISTPPSTPPELNGKVSPTVADTDRVPDASRISPPVLKPEVRNGHDVAVSVKLDAGVPVQDLTVANHKAVIEKDGDRRAQITLDPADSIPNKDFVLRYDVTGAKPEIAVLAHTGNYTDARRLGSGYFLLMIQPREDEQLAKSPPREIVFLVDVSGSMSGEPTAKVIDAMQNMLQLCRPQDTVQVITFAGAANKLFEKPVPVTEGNINKALNFTSGLQGGGGTEMLTGVKAAIDEPIDNERMRIVVMLTDGYIGNEAEIIEHVGKNCGDQIRFWCIGIGSSPNMFLVDGVAKQGGGMGKQLGLQDDTTALTQEVMNRIQRAQLAKIRLDWGGLQVVETYPARIPELWAGRPVILVGRYNGGGSATVTVHGNVEGQDVSWPLNVDLPSEQQQHDVLAKIWARRKIEDLMQQTFYHGSPAVEEEVTAIALDYRLMSQYTSFVAVDESEASQQPASGPPRQMLVPVPLPHGTRWQGFFGPLGEGLERGEGDALDRFGGEVAREFKNVAYQRQFRRARDPMAVTRAGLSLQSPSSGPARLLSAAKQPSRNYASRPMPATGAALFGRFAGGRADLDDVRDGIAVDGWGYSVDFEATLQAQAGMMAAEAPKFLEEGRRLKSDKQRADARVALEHAFHLDSAASHAGLTSGEVASAAVEALIELRDEQVKEWIEHRPSLKRNIDLVLRDASLQEALQMVADQAQMRLTLVEGSAEDAASLVSDDNLRVDYLDLRGLTVAQALDQILLPRGLTWQIAGDKVLAASQRRLPGKSAWIYDVSVIALPDLKTLVEAQDYEKAATESRSAADKFLAVVREALSSNEPAATWYGPGQMLIVGDDKMHTAAEKLFSALADPRAKLSGSAAELQNVTSKRASDRKEDLTKRTADFHRDSIVARHVEFGWKLLTAATTGDVDREALTHLHIAWRDPATTELLQGSDAIVPLRSLWILAETSRATGKSHPELEELLTAARRKSEPAFTKVLNAAAANADDESAKQQLLFATLTLRDDQQWVEKAMPLLIRKPATESPATILPVVAQALLGDIDHVDTAALTSLVKSGVAGDDMVLLAALTCHTIGEETRSLLRMHTEELVGGQPVNDHVVVILSRLTGSEIVKNMR